jgi:hypothetical protein
MIMHRYMRVRHLPKMEVCYIIDLMKLKGLLVKIGVLKCLLAKQSLVFLFKTDLT